MERELDRRGFMKRIIGGGTSYLLLNSNPLNARGAPLNQDFIRESAQRGRNLEGYLRTKNYGELLDKLGGTYKIPKTLIQAVVGVEGGTPWIGATRTPYFQNTFRTGIEVSGGKVRRVGAVGLPQMFNPAYIEAVEYARGGDSSLISNSQIGLLQIPLEEELNLIKHGTTPTVAYQSELVASYLNRLANWMFRGTRTEKLTPEQLTVLSQSYNSGALSLIRSSNLQSQEGTRQLATTLIENPRTIKYLVDGVDRNFARKIMRTKEELKNN